MAQGYIECYSQIYTDLLCGRMSSLSYVELLVCFHIRANIFRVELLFLRVVFRDHFTQAYIIMFNMLAIV